MATSGGTMGAALEAQTEQGAPASSSATTQCVKAFTGMDFMRSLFRCRGLRTRGRPI
jgi:hypothetical protein